MKQTIKQKVFGSTNLLNDEKSEIVLNILMSNFEFIKYSEIKKHMGYQNKQTIKRLLTNQKYDFTHDVYYKFENIKKGQVVKPLNEIYMKIDTIKTILLLSPTAKGHEFRKYYIEMEKLFRKYVTKSYSFNH